MKDFFEKEKIEYYKVLPYSLCREISPNIISREQFSPMSVILFLIPYYGGETVNISRYSASRDYHLYIKELGSRLVGELLRRYPENKFKIYGDHSPIDERHAALVSGLGILGDNGLLINEKYGSYVFVADIITDIPPNKLGALAVPASVRTCCHCGICKKMCPTGILRAKGDACLSAITQKKGELSDAEADMMRKYNTAWGCDECQVHCPCNRRPEITPIEFFKESRIEELTAEVLSSMTKKEFSERAFAWRGRKTAERNIDILAKSKKK